MTIVEFAEKVLDMKLYSYQKKYLEDMYEKYKHEGKLIINYPPGRSMGVNGLRTLAAIYFRKLERGEFDESPEM